MAKAHKIYTLARSLRAVRRKNPVMTRGFVYVATGTAYLSEAFKSAGSLRRHHPDAVICLITDHPPDDRGPFSEIRRPIGKVRHSPMD